MRHRPHLNRDVNTYLMDPDVHTIALAMDKIHPPVSTSFHRLAVLRAGVELTRRNEDDPIAKWEELRNLIETDRGYRQRARNNLVALYHDYVRHPAALRYGREQYQRRKIQRVAGR